LSDFAIFHPFKNRKRGDVMKTESVNVYRERIYQAQLYIQNNLLRDFTLDEVAQAVCFSPYHFHRLYSVYTGEGVYGYTRRLRLQHAAEKLCLTAVTIEEAAKQIHYDTVAAFNKAFKAHFGETPAAYRRTIQKDRRDSFVLTNECIAADWQPIEPEPLRIDPFDVRCIRRVGSCLQAGYAAWTALETTIRDMGIDWQPLRKFGITVDSPDIVEDTRVRYDAGVILDGGVQKNGFLFTQRFGGGEYAVFTHVGTYETLWKTYLGICLGWLPENDVVLRDTFWFDEYCNRPEEVAPEKLVTRIHVPIRS
jgi:AraC family transcriptional regulator